MKIALVCLDKTSGDPPLGLAYIASYIRKYGGFNDIIIVDKEDALKRIKKEKPDVVGFSSMTYEFHNVNAFAGIIKKEFNVPTIIGGIHISALPQHLSRSNFDLAVLGEGEQTMLELMQVYEKYGEFPKNELKRINGVAFRGNGKVFITKPREFIEPLDKIPYPARDLLKMKDWYLTPRRTQFQENIGIYTSALTSRGCPYNCTFCSSTKFWKKVRFNSPQCVLGEIKELVEKYKVDGIAFADDLFIADKRRLEEIVKLVREEGFNKKIEFFVDARANLIDDKTCKLLRSMNVTAIFFGLESGCERTLNYLKKGSVTVKQNRNALKVCKENGLRTWGSFIIGNPGETKEDMMKTLDLVRDRNLDIANVGQLTPFPDNEVWSYAKEIGVVSDDFGFDFSQLTLDYKPDIILTKEMSRENFKKIFFMFQKELAKKYYANKSTKIKLKYLKYLFNPGFIKRIITHRRAAFGILKSSKIQIK